MEDAGFEIRDCLAWLYGSGFPKSLDVSKAIDKAAGAEREATASAQTVLRASLGRWLLAALCVKRVQTVTAPATPDAERWQGWGTALKPAHEPIVMARKPLAGTVAANVLEHGTGALNVDGCRIAIDEAERAVVDNRSGATSNQDDGVIYGEGLGNRELGTRYTSDPAGRWPANVVLDEQAAEMLDEQTGTLHSQDPATRAE